MGTHPIFESDFDCLTDKMRLTGALTRNTRKTVKYLRRASQLEMKSIKNNYPIGINSYLFKNKEDATAYSGVQGGRLTGTNQKQYEERIAKEKYGYWAPKLISDVKAEYSFATQTMDQNIWSFQQRPWMRYGNEGDRLPYNKVPVLFIKFRWNETEFRYWDPNWAKYYNNPLKETNPPKIMKAKHNWYDDMHEFMNRIFKTNMEENGMIWAKKREEANIEIVCKKVSAWGEENFGHPYVRLVYSMWSKQPNMPQLFVKHLSLSGTQIVSITDTTPLREHIKTQ